jgi:hypothetical protein
MVLALVFSTFPGGGLCFAQQAERMYGKNRVLKTNAYYLEQLRLWEKKVHDDPADADAWYNYYRASRNAYIVGEETDSLKAKGAGRFHRLEAIVQEMRSHVPESYEYNFVVWLNGNGNPDLLPFLERAHRLAPDRSEPLQSLAYYYETVGDTARRNEALTGWYRSGDCSPGLLNYAYNMLAGMEHDAIVFTEGDKDTDAIFVLQGARRMRTDVRVLNVNLLLNAEYRARAFRDLGIDPLTTDPLRDDAALAQYRGSIVSHCVGNAARRPVHVAVSVSEPYIAAIAERLHLIGLTWRYSATAYDALPQLVRNYEEAFALDYLRVYLPYDISEGNVREFNQNYLPSLALLEQHYRAIGDSRHASHCQALARRIADDAGTDDVYYQYFGH